MKVSGTVPSSFRDPCGFLFYRDSLIHRQVNGSYREHYDHLMESGLYESLVASGLLIPHEEVDLSLATVAQAYKVLRPHHLPFISYPYEWCFSQLKAAAMATLAIQRRAFEFGMTLKDASAYNVQFHNGRPLLIDTLSFERYQAGSIWTPYRQFCQQFLAPLALMACADSRLGQYLRICIDGIPLDFASRCLPLSTHLRLPLLTHIHLHARSQKRYSSKDIRTEGRRMSRTALAALVASLEAAIRSLHWQPKGTEWADYYARTNYSSRAHDHKSELVSRFLDVIEPTPRSVWDLGANTGLFSRMAADKGMAVLSFDVDPAAVETSWLECVRRNETRMLPLLVDLSNPSPAIGWSNAERMSLIQRGPADAVLALALLHHLVISNNVPLELSAAFFAKIGRWLIIEFVPKSDSQVQRLLASREDVFPHYTQPAFEEAFGKHFVIRRVERVADSERTLYLMEKFQEQDDHWRG